MGAPDIVLRQIARHRPEGLARAFVPDARAIEVVGWIDSQVTSVERRLDKALRLRVDGEPCVLHVEFCFRLRRDLPDRMFEYLSMLFMALRAETPREPVAPIESVAVVLSGPRARVASSGRRRTSWRGRRFSGVHYAIDAVYQRTVAELRARESLFWLVLAPLARDATIPLLREALRDLLAGAGSAEEREDLLQAFFVIATIDPWAYGLHKELTMTILEGDDEELGIEWPDVRAWLRKRDEKAREAGREEGREEAVSDLLGRLFARRVGRTPTKEETNAIVQRSKVLGEGEVEDALLELERDALLRWLSEPLPSPR